MSAYQNDDRVHPWPNGLWTVAATCGTEVIDYIVADEGGHFDAYVDERRLESISGQDFDEVVHALIGDPR